MTIPEDWLLGPISLAEVEQELAEEGAPDLWLRQWRAFLESWVPGDELWEYSAVESQPDCAATDFRVGFALVREGKIVDGIEAPETIA
jgi:hypothetical protein